MPQLDVFLLILRLLFIVLIYLFLLQVVLAITRDLKAKAPAITEKLVVYDARASQSLKPGMVFKLLPQTKIGRGPINDMRLDDAFISNEHALMHYRDGRWHVQDLRSSAGTFVNGNRLLPNTDTPVKVGDYIILGPIVFQLVA